MASQYFNPFEAIKPSPYVPMFNMELAMKAGEMAKEREDQGIEMESALQEMFGNIRPTTGDTTKRYVDELQSKYDTQIKDLASKVGSYADPDNLRAIRKLVTNFRSNPNLKHIVEFEALKKADALENAKLRKEGKLVQIDFTRDDALVYNPETNQYEPSEFQSGMEVKQDWQKPLIDAVARYFQDSKVFGSNAKTLSRVMAGSADPLIDVTKTQIDGYKAIDPKEIVAELETAFGLYVNDPAVQQRIRAEKFSGKSEDVILGELKNEFEQEALAQSKTKRVDEIMSNALFKAKEEETKNNLRSNLQESYQTSFDTNSSDGIHTLDDYQRTMNKGRNKTPVQGDRVDNDVARTAYTAWIRNEGDVLISDISTDTQQIAELIVSEDITRSPGFVNWVTSNILMNLSFSPRGAGIIPDNHNETLKSLKEEYGENSNEVLEYLENHNIAENFRKKVKESNVNITEILNEMVANGDFNEAKSVLGGAIRQIRKNHISMTGDEINIIDEEGMLKKIQPFEETIAKIEKAENSLDTFYKQQQDVFTADLANTMVYEFGIGKDNEGAESEIQRRINANLPSRKFEFFDEFGNSIKSKDRKNISKIYGVTTIGTTTILFGTSGSGDRQQDITVHMNDEVALGKLNKIANSPLLSAAIEFRNITVVDDDYVWNKGKNKKIPLPDGYSFESRVIDGQLNISLLKDGIEVSVDVPDHLGGLNNVKYLPPQDAFLFLDEIIENNPTFRSKLR
jgi:hypothetical protein